MSKYPEEQDLFDGSCPRCEEPFGAPDCGDIHEDDGEFIAISHYCYDCNIKVEAFYDFDRIEIHELGDDDE